MTPLEVIQRLYTAFQHRDDTSFRKLCSPDIEWIQNEGFPGGDTYRGSDAIIDGVFNRNNTLWEDFRFEIESMHAAEDVVTVIGQYTGTSHVSKQPFHAAAVHIYNVDGNGVTKFRQFTDTHILHQFLAS